MLLHATNNEGDELGLTDVQVRHQAMTLALAGHDTTAGVLPWVWYLLAKHPEAETRIISEIDEVLKGQPATADDLPNLLHPSRRQGNHEALSSSLCPLRPSGGRGY